MAVTFRSTKGAPLTHDELDQNFREFFYSSSYMGPISSPSGINIYKRTATNATSSIYFPTAVGNNYNIQIKSGSANISSSFLTGSTNFSYNFDTDHFSVSGSSQFGGNVIVKGTVTAREFKSELVSSSIVYQSGSTKSGDTIDDRHEFTGSLLVSGSTTLNGTVVSTQTRLLSASAQIASEISGSSTSLSASLAVDIATNKASSGSFSSRITSNDDEISSLTAATSSYLLNTTDTFTGDLTVTGVITAQVFNTEYVSSSIIYESGSTKFGDSADDTHQFTGSINIDGNLALPGIANVSASIALLQSGSGASNVSITNNANNRVLTATGTDVLNGEANLSFDGTALTVSGTKITKFTSADTDINTLLGGSTSGSLIQGISSGHFVIGMREDDLTDSFAIIGGAGDFYSTTNYDKLLFRVSGSGNTYVGGTLTTEDALTVGGAITATGDITAFYSSDEKLKDNVTPISNAIDKVNQIGGYEFDWNSNSEHSGHDVGVIAQEIEKVLPEIVVNRDNGYKAVRYEKIVALLIQAVKEQQLQINELKSKL